MKAINLYFIYTLILSSLFIICSFATTTENQHQQQKESIIINSDNGISLASTGDSFTFVSNGGSTILSHNYQETTSKSLIDDESIQSIVIHYNNNYESDVSTDLYPLVSQPIVQVLINYKKGAKQTTMDSYSTIKTLPFNDTVALCTILESVLDLPIQPCSTFNSKFIDNLSHMGLVPSKLKSPFFMGITDFNNDNSNENNNDRSRFIQSTNSLNSQDFILFALGANQSSFLSSRSLYFSNTLKDTAKNNILPLNSKNNADHFIGMSITITKSYIQLNEMASYKSNNNIVLEKNKLSETSSLPVSFILYTVKSDLTELLTYKEGKIINELQPPTKLDNPEVAHLITPTDPRIASTSILFNQRTVVKQGFHRELISNISISTSGSGAQNQCSLLFLEHFDQGIFVDQYEVDEIHRFGGPQVNIYQLIDLEKPSATSTQNYISVETAPFVLDSENITHLTVTLPIHFRYQNPSIDSEFRQSLISPPIVYIRCQADLGGEWKRVANIKSPQTKPIKTNIPVGQLNVQNDISLYTLGVTFIGSLIVIMTIGKISSKSISIHLKNN
ncbi:hypothetical protein CYY_008816 [Polysphondylium violaceum]|uniref:Phosphatidylinositol glycan n=1 Tax=Polysphondylium violaceum TaxID=133409 RepID=A0A8J4PMK5_9MYCE|nr:hypothetical protein CYY_008816 [Polysphondylium violaceum]